MVHPPWLDHSQACSVSSAYAGEKRKADQTGLVQPVLEFYQVLWLPYGNISGRLLKSRDHSALSSCTLSTEQYSTLWVRLVNLHVCISGDRQASDRDGHCSADAQV